MKLNRFIIHSQNNAKKNAKKKKETFAGGRVFKVKSNTLMRARFGHRKWQNYEKILRNEECLDDVREFCKKDQKTPVILKDEYGIEPAATAVAAPTGGAAAGDAAAGDEGKSEFDVIL